ncbi:hypothetical protein JKP88DRAFT_163887 [Tribonema minus]|uniref:Cytokinin riboside 5'-monophosphate phosphoribohydrolase n=1 Tax=Tribonema minus TaxID=303371 RepID=A0A836CF56_9STRA|nr:hypothetical protein JKP88DRAFT_163887 [Tribonema minus]
MPPLTVCVYGSSSPRTPQKYLDESHRLGHLLSEGGHLCINGAGKHGCMGALNDGVQQANGRVRGVIHAKWVVDQAEHPNIMDLIVVEGDDLQERKKALVHGVDVIIALPGGPGTWDEMWEMACQRGIGFSGVPIVAVNTDGFYDGFVQQLQRADKDGLLYLPPKDLVHFEPDAESALRWCVEHINSLAPDAHVIPVKVSSVSATIQW